MSNYKKSRNSDGQWINRGRNNENRWRGGRFTQNRVNFDKFNGGKNYKKQEKNLPLNDDNMFPVLVENVSCNKESNYNFINAITNNDLDIQKDESKEDIKVGWTIINKNDKSIKVYNNKGLLVDRIKSGTYMNMNNNNNNNNVIDVDEIHKVYLGMCKRWCNYYDEINYLLGDRSPYINYKNDIRKIISEENDIMNKIYGEDYNSSTDDEKDCNDDVNFW